MKMFLIVYSHAADYVILQKMKKTGIKGYTKMKEACGEGTETEPKLGTHTWPGENDILYIAAEDEDVTVVSDMIRQLKTEHPRAGVKGFVLPMEEII